MLEDSLPNLPFFNFPSGTETGGCEAEGNAENKEFLNELRYLGSKRGGGAGQGSGRMCLSTQTHVINLILLLYRKKATRQFDEA